MVTLKDIAQAMGVTTTTVHRALQGKSGVSEETRREIQHVAAQMGYRANYLAASLKRKNLRLAIALPEPTGNDRFYYNNLWQGAKQLLEEVAEFNITPLEFSYPLAQGASGAILKQIYEHHLDGLDGLLTVAIDSSQSPQASYFIEKFAEAKIPMVFIGGDLYAKERLCCVKTHDEMTGCLAAELLTAFAEDDTPKKIVAIGNYGPLGMLDQQFNMAGFTEYMQQHAPYVQLQNIINSDVETSARLLRQSLQEQPDLYAVYACSSRHTVVAAQVVAELGLQNKLKLIGNDVFSESIEYLNQGILRVIINKKTKKQGYLAAKALFNFTLKGEYPPCDIIYVQPSVLLRSSLSAD